MEARGDTIQDGINEIVVCHLGIDIKSINIILVFLNSTALPEISDLIASPVWFTVVTILFSNGILNLFPSSIPVPVSFPPF